MSKKRLYTREEVEKMSTESYMRGMSVQDGQIKQNNGYTFNKWLNKLIDTIKPKQR